MWIETSYIIQTYAQLRIILDLACEYACASRETYNKSTVSDSPVVVGQRDYIRDEAILMDGVKGTLFAPTTFLAKPGLGRKNVRLRAKQVFFAQGSVADSIFYLQAGRAKLTVVSTRGKEATVTLLMPGDFFGEESLADANGHRVATASAMTACSAMQLEKGAMRRALHEEHAFSDFFLRFMVHRSMKTQADLVDQLFNSSERRLARTLLLMAEFGQPGEPETLIPRITQETLAEMIGTTRSRVSFFMNRFRKLGYIEYKGRIRVNKTLLNVVLHDQLPEQNASRPTMVDASRTRAEKLS
jgi:CRP/FNR family cyclic AMP-dependent transcriptional regulator